MRSRERQREWADDGYTSGAAGVNSVTMTANNAITNFQDAYAKKAVDTLNDLRT